MKTKRKLSTMGRFILLSFLLSSLFFASCTKEDSNQTTPADSSSAIDDVSRTIDDYSENDADKTFIWARVYRIKAKTTAGIRGFAVFRKTPTGQTIVRLNLVNTIAGTPLPAHIHENAVIEGGSLAITLNPVNGASGKSTTLVSQDDAGNPLTFADMAMYNGHLKIHAGASSPQVIACTNIGGNKLTPIKKVYPLFKADTVNNIKGFIVFRKRVNNNSLAMIKLQNTISGILHPAHIHLNDVATGGPIALTFNPVDGDNGVSLTNVKQLDNGSPFKYWQILQFNGHVKVHLSSSNLAVVSRGDIGSNF